MIVQAVTIDRGQSNTITIQLRDSSQTFKPVQSVAHNKAQVQVQPLQVLEKNLYKGNLFVEKSCSAPGETEITRIRGITFIADGRLVIIDGKNKNIKIFQPEWFDLVARKELVDEPRGITCISQDDVVITFADKREVRVYRIDKANNLWKQRSFGMKDKPFSISCSKKTFAIEIGEGDDGMIAVTDFNGNITHLVRGHNANFGQFTGNTIRLVHDNDSKRLFVVNVSDGYIHCVDYYGEVKWFIKINTPRGVTLHENTLFVASKGDNKICQVNTGNGNMYDLLSDKDRTRQPRFIAFHPSKGKLAVEVGSNINFYIALKPSK